MTSVVQPLIDGLSEYTNYTLFVLGGMLPEHQGGQFDLIRLDLF